MRRLDGLGTVFLFTLAALVPSTIRAGIPLPDTIVYGTIDLGGRPVASSEVEGLVSRQEFPDLPLSVPGEVRDVDGEIYYILRIPLEADIGAPEAPGAAARESDVLEEVILDGNVVCRPGIVLAAAKVERTDCGVLPQSRFVRGDSNGDSGVTLGDAIYLLGCLFLGTECSTCQDAADANDDGKLTQTDAIFALGCLFRGTTCPPPPYPGCGTDPTSDSLTCEIGLSDCQDGAGGIGGPGGVVRQILPGAPDAEEDFDGRPSGPQIALGDAANETQYPLATLSRAGREDLLAVSVHQLDISPLTVRMGETAGGPTTKSLSFGNRGGVDLELALTTDSDLISVFPTLFTLPAGGSFVALIESNDMSSLEDRGRDEREAIDYVSVTAGGTLLARIGIESTWEPSKTAVRIGNAVVPEGAVDTVALSVDLTRPLVGKPLAPERLTLTLDYDSGRFGSPELLPTPGIEWMTRAIQADGTFSIELSLPDDMLGGTIGRFLLKPRAPLAAGTYPVLATASEAGEPLTTAHGEICSQRAWLDVDGDGRANLAVDLVLVERFYRGRDILQPASWRNPVLPEHEIQQRIEARSAYFDVDRSGSFDRADLAAIARGLSGFRISGRDRTARVGNLFVTGRHASGFSEYPEGIEKPEADGDVATLSLSTCVFEELDGTLIGTIDSTAPLIANQLHVALDYPAELLVVDTVESGSSRAHHGIEAEFENDPSTGHLEMVLYRPDGAPLDRVAGGLLRFTAHTEGPARMDVEFSVTSVGASLGRDAVALRGSVASYPTEEICDPECEQFEEGVLKMADALALLDFLFGEGLPPDCPGRLDTDGDGVLSIRDVLSIVRGVR